MIPPKMVEALVLYRLFLFLTKFNSITHLSLHIFQGRFNIEGAELL